MNRDTQLKVQAYLDNELSTGDARSVSKLISSDAQARELYEELKSMREALVHNEPQVQLPETREFYWSQLQRRIAAAERAPVATSTRPWWVRLAAPIAGTVALCAVLLSVVNRDGAKPLGELSQGVSQSAPSTSAQQTALQQTPLHHLEQSSDVSTITFRSDTEGVTVVWISNAQ